MGTKQHFVLFESVSGFSLFLVKEFDEIVRKFSAHVNSFLKPVAFVPFNSVTDALDNVQSINEGKVSSLLKIFLIQNMPIKDSILGVADQTLGESILALDYGFECIWDASIREILRIIRSNSARLLRSLIVQPSNSLTASIDPSAATLPVRNTTSANEIVPGHQAERRARLVVALSRARLQLDLLQHMADTGVVRSLALLDSMDKSLSKSVRRLKTAYALHFPEICRDKELRMDDFALVSIIGHCPARHAIAEETDRLAAWTGSQADSESIRMLASTSVGQDLAEDDLKTLQGYAQFLLKLIKSRSKCCEMLERRVRSLVPNLTALMDKALPLSDVSDAITVPNLERVQKVGDRVSSVFIVARLLSHAVNLDRLARMPSSRISSLGASKSLFRQSGAVAASSVGLLGSVSEEATKGLVTSNCSGNTKTVSENIAEMSGGRLKPIVIRRRVARLLAAKSTLACRADCYRQANPFLQEQDKKAKTDQSTDPKIDQLDSGTYGASLGDEIKRQLKVWAEAKGVQFGRSTEEVQKQRNNRKMYRKRKHKAWLQRKISTVTSSNQNISEKTPITLPVLVSEPNKNDSDVDLATYVCRKRAAPTDDSDDDLASVSKRSGAPSKTLYEDTHNSEASSEDKEKIINLMPTRTKKRLTTPRQKKKPPTPNSKKGLPRRSLRSTPQRVSSFA